MTKKKKLSRKKRKQQREKERTDKVQKEIPVEKELAVTAEVDYGQLLSDNVAKENKKYRSYIGFSYIVVFFVYCEIVFHLVRVGAPNIDLGYKTLFALAGGGIAAFLIGLLPRKIAKPVTGFLLTVVSIYYIAQIIYSGVFATYLSLWGTKDVAGQALDFTNVIWNAVKKEWFVIFLFLLPLVVFFLWGIRKLDFSGYTVPFYGVLALTIVLIYLINFAWMQTDSDVAYSAYDLYKNYTSVDMTVTRLGVLEGLVLDTREGMKDILGIQKNNVQFATETVTTTEAVTEADVLSEEEESIDTSPNVLNIDLNRLAESEENESVAALHSYIAGLEPTDKNEYTGMFEGYNVIFVVAEGFSGYCIDKERTPTLYRLTQEGFHFKNYYTPLWYGSTLGGEFADLTGLMPKNGGYLSMQKVGKNKNDMMFTLSKQLEKQNYKITAYHANSNTYYERDVSRPVLGYDDWIAVGTGYEPELGTNGKALWPQSDLRLVEKTFDDYATDEPFYTYYLTVSGHVEYSFAGNAMSKRHEDFVKDMDYSDTTKAYIACQDELELAMTKLVENLEETGLADHTVIVLTADHVPYDNKEVVDELAGEKLDETFDWYKNALIVWSGSMEEPVEVEKYCSSIDVLPTISNLLGLPYDSRMLAGQDILSDSEGIVIFNDRSFLTDTCRYNAGTGKAEAVSGETVSKEYLDSHIAYVKNKFSMAESIVDTDYYRYIDEALQEN